MELELNDVQQELKAILDRLLKQKYDFSNRDAVLASEQGWSRAMWKQYADLGLLGLPFAAEHGGAGMGFAEVAVVMEELGRHLVLEPYLATVVLGGGLVNAAGTSQQKLQLLPGVSEGDSMLAFAGFEPRRRYDLRSPLTTASSHGAAYVVSGEKARVLGGDAATCFVVSAAVDDEIGLFLVDANADGVSVDARAQIDGNRSASVLFERSPATRLGSGDASEYISLVIDMATAALAAEAVGAMESSLARTVEYLKVRKQFGRPIGRNQVLQHRAAEVYASLEDARSMALYAKLAITRSETGKNKDRHRDVIAAKVVVDQSAVHVSKESIQMHGGIGMAAEYPIAHYAKRLSVIVRALNDTDRLSMELATSGGFVVPHAADI